MKRCYCPICCEDMIYDPFDNCFLCIECELVLPVSTEVDNPAPACYPGSRPRPRGSHPFSRRAAVLTG